MDLLAVPSGVRGQGVLQPGAHAVDLIGDDLDVAGLTLHPLHGGLVDEDARVGQGQTLALAAGGQEHGGGGGRLPQADGLHLRLDVLHGVVDGRQRREGSAGTVDVHGDETVWVLGLQDQELGHDVVGGGVVDLDTHEDDAVLEELGVRVLTLEAVGGALLELGQHVTGLRHGTGLAGDGLEVGTGRGHVSCLRSACRSPGWSARCGRRIRTPGPPGPRTSGRGRSRR